MAYCSDSDVREIIGIDDYMPSSTVISEFIAKADAKLDQKLAGSAYRTTQVIHYTGDGRFLDLKYNFRSVKKISVNGEEVTEFRQSDLLDDGECDYSSDSTPDYWNELESSGDTLTWDSNYSYTLSRSLKIEKGGASESYWYSDDIEVISTQQEYRAEAKIKVDSNSSGSVYLRLEFRDSDETSLKTFDSPVVTIQITQPSSASAIAVVSTSASDIQNLIIEGTVNGVHDSEVVAITGTTSVSSSKSFSEITGLRLDSAAVGTITATSNAAVVTNATFTVGQTLKEDWQSVQIEGASPHDVNTARVLLRCTSSSGGSCWGDSFRVYKRNWKPRPSVKNIEFFSSLSKGDSIRASYLRSSLHPFVPIISAKIAALYTLSHITGADTAGENFEDLKAGKYGGAALFSRFKHLRMEIGQDLKDLLKHDHSVPDAVLGRFR